ncbi:MAG TPA: hypothetical protein VGD22_01085, partial [Sphingobacteriaceae bacterium]
MMGMIYKVLLICILTFYVRMLPGFCQDYRPQVSIVPAVANITGSPGSFKFNKQTVIRADAANNGVAAILTDYLSAVN